MSITELGHQIDSFLLDEVFQPLVDRFPFEVSPWQIGMNFQLGALIFQTFAIFLPIIFFGSSFTREMENLLALGGGAILFIGFSRMRPILKPNGMNPLRPALYSLRIMSLLFLAYDFYLLAKPSQISFIIEKLATIGDIVYVIGLYFMACRMSPPRQRSRQHLSQSAWSTTD